MWSVSFITVFYIPDVQHCCINLSGFFCTYQVEETKKMVIGDPLDRGTGHGPQNHRFVRLTSFRNHFQPQ